MAWGAVRGATLHLWGPRLVLQQLRHSLTTFPRGWERGEQHQTLDSRARGTPRVTAARGCWDTSGGVGTSALSSRCHARLWCPQHAHPSAPPSASPCRQPPVALETHPALLPAAEPGRGAAAPAPWAAVPAEHPLAGHKPEQGEALPDRRSCSGRALQGCRDSPGIPPWMQVAVGHVVDSGGAAQLLRAVRDGFGEGQRDPSGLALPISWK